MKVAIETVVYRIEGKKDKYNTRPKLEKLERKIKKVYSQLLWVSPSADETDNDIMISASSSIPMNKIKELI